MLQLEDTYEGTEPGLSPCLGLELAVLIGNVEEAEQFLAQKDSQKYLYRGLFGRPIELAVRRDDGKMAECILGFMGRMFKVLDRGNRRHDQFHTDIYNASELCVGRGTVDMLQRLVHHYLRRNPYLPKQDYDTLLLKAVTRKPTDLNMVKAVLSIKIKKGYRVTPEAIAVACSKGNKPLVQLLLSTAKTAELKSLFRKAHQPLQEAIMSGSHETVSLLPSAGADPDPPKARTLPLYIVAGEGHLEVVLLLLDSGADINATTAYSWCSSMCAAARKGHVDVFKLLLERGAIPNPDCMSMKTFAFGSNCRENMFRMMRCVRQR